MHEMLLNEHLPGYLECELVSYYLNFFQLSSLSADFYIMNQIFLLETDIMSTLTI
jgi:hypothetical protein